MKQITPYFIERNRQEAEQELTKISKRSSRFARAAAATSLAVLALAGTIKEPQHVPEALTVPPLFGLAAYFQRKKAKHNMTWVLNDYMASEQMKTEKQNSNYDGYENIEIARFNIESLGATKGVEYALQHTAMGTSGYMLGADIANKIPESAQSSYIPMALGLFAVGAAMSVTDKHNSRMEVSKDYLDLVDKTIGYSTRIAQIDRSIATIA